MMAFTDSMPPSGSVEWQTPADKFAAANEIFAFTLDGAASHTNALCARYCTADGTFQRVPAETVEILTGARYGRGNACMCKSPGQAGAHERWCFALAQEVAPGIWAVKIDDRDGLAFPWAGERVMLNPPWGESREACVPGCTKTGCKKRGHAERFEAGVAEFVRKCRDEALRHRALVWSITPARTDNGWFQDDMRPWARYTFERHRWRFGDPEAAERIARGEKPREAPPVGVITALWR